MNRGRRELGAELALRNHELQLAQERLLRILESNADAIVVIDREGVVQLTNSAAEKLFGRSRERLVGSPFGFPVASGETTELDLPNQRVAEMRVVDFAWEGQPASLLSLRDVTGRREAEEAARRLWRERTAREEAEKERARLQELLARAPAAVLTTRGPNHVCVFANPGAAHLAPARALVGRPLRETLAELAGQGFLEGFDRALEAGASTTASEIEVTFAASPGGAPRSRCLDLTWQPLRSDGHVDGVMCFAHDVTAKVTMRRELEEAMECLQEEERRKDQFMAVLGHELRNPLAGIDGGLRLLEEGAEGERGTWALGMMRKQVKQLTGLLDDLLDVSSIARGKLQLRRRVVRLDQLVETAVATTGARFGARGQTLMVKLPDEPLHVAVDTGRFEQILCNLLGNALKYSAAGTEVTLVVRRDGGDAVIAVRDHGIGIAPEMIDEIFEPFTQGARADGSPLAGGLGIGLTLVRQLVELHGGTVTAASPGVDRGSTFTVRVPLAAAPRVAVEAAAAEEPAEAVGASLHRVLVVDDNRDAAEALTELLNLSCCHAVAAGSGGEALALAEDGSFHVVLLDLDLPDMTGFEVAEQLRRVRDPSELLLVAISGFGHEQARQRSLDSGIDHHLVKPVDIAQLLALIGDHSRRTREPRVEDRGRPRSRPATGSAAPRARDGAGN